MARNLGLGVIAKYDADDSGTATDTISLLIENTPPPRVRQRVDGVTLGDTLAVDGAGIELQSDYTFTIFVEMNDTQHAAFNTLFGNKTVIFWNLTFTSGDIMTFEGILMEIVPQGVVADQYVQERYTVHRTGAIAYT